MPCSHTHMESTEMAEREGVKSSEPTANTHGHTFEQITHTRLTCCGKHNWTLLWARSQTGNQTAPTARQTNTQRPQLTQLKITKALKIFFHKLQKLWNLAMCFVWQKWSAMHTVSGRQMLLCSSTGPHTAPEMYTAMQRGLHKSNL